MATNNLTGKAKLLIDKQLQSIGINTEEQFGFDFASVGAALAKAGPAIKTGASAVGKWVTDNPEMTASLVQGGIALASGNQESGQALAAQGQALKKSSNPQQQVYGDILGFVGELQMMAATMRTEMVNQGILTKGAQDEQIRNAYADMLYSQMLSTNKKATLIYVINKLDRSVQNELAKQGMS